MTLWHWIRTLLSGRPHQSIGGEENPYLRRWYLIPHNRWINVYLHQFLRDDDDRALHDHPWWFASLMVRGGYYEWMECPTPSQCRLSFGDQCVRVRRAPSIAFRRATHRHRVQLMRDESSQPIPCWTIVITGPRVREWGFWCPKGFVPWRRFLDVDGDGTSGPGCGGAA